MRFVRLILVGLSFLMGCAGDEAPEHSTLTWDRNQEADMQDYLVYVCGVDIACVPNGEPISVVPQTPVGIDPQLLLDLHGDGALAVRARDTHLNLSPFSDVLPYHRG